MSTIISHFYNEEYLLPWWLKNHLPLFEYGILIDHHSDDRSAEICHDLAPHWKVVKSANTNFDAVRCDEEVMFYERTVAGLKIVLNTTEFLRVKNNSLKDLTSSLAENQGVWIPSFAIVDHEGKDPGPDESLIDYFGDAYDPGHFRSRLCHKFEDGKYLPGRHETHHPGIQTSTNAFIGWLEFAPWTERFIQRKLQIQKRIPDSDRALGRGYQHFVARDELESRKKKAQEKTFKYKARFNSYNF